MIFIIIFNNNNWQMPIRYYNNSFPWQLLIRSLLISPKSVSSSDILLENEIFDDELVDFSLSLMPAQFEFIYLLQVYCNCSDISSVCQYLENKITKISLISVKYYLIPILITRWKIKLDNSLNKVTYWWIK